MQACNRCRHFKDAWGNLCDKPEYRDPDPIYGFVPTSATTARKDGGACGPAAAGFERRVPLLARLFGPIR